MKTKSDLIKVFKTIMNTTLGILTFCTISCTETKTPTHKAAEIIDRLEKNAEVEFIDYKSNKPSMIVSFPGESSTYVMKYDLLTGTADTIASDLIARPLAVREGNKYYLIVAPEFAEGAERLSFSPFLYKKGSTTYDSWIKDPETGKELVASSFMIDNVAQQLVLTGLYNQDKVFEDRYDVFDFDGNHQYSATYKHSKELPKSESQDATYLWQCNKCGKKKTSSKNPNSFFDWDCSGSAHDWVKISRIE